MLMLLELTEKEGGAIHLNLTNMIYLRQVGAHAAIGYADGSIFVCESVSEIMDILDSGYSDGSDGSDGGGMVDGDGGPAGSDPNTSLN